MGDSMGTKLKELVTKRAILINELSGKVLFVDAFNVLYQFLTTIRQMDGTPLKTSSGIVTSHLVGLFNRTTKLMLEGVRPAFVFDGQAPKLKHQERERRSESKLVAMERFEEAKQAEDIEGMKKYAARTSRLTGEMVEDSKQLLRSLGIPVIHAPGEGEAQAAYMVLKGLGYGVVSEDYDTLLFGVPRLIKGLSISQRKKERDVLSYAKSEIEEIELSKLLSTLKISQEGLIALGMLIGTDFNPGGIKGIGPKKALKLVQANGADLSRLFEEVKWGEHFSYPWEEVFSIFRDAKHTDDFKLEWGKPDPEEVRKLLIGRFEFSESAVEKRLEQMEKTLVSPRQQSLGRFL
jgi:flap endonuclease-1